MLTHLRLIYPYLLRYRRYYLFGAVAIALTNVLTMLSPLVLRRAINRLETGGETSQLTGDALLIVGLALGAGVFRFLVRRSVIWASRKIEFDLRGDLFRHVSELDQTFFDKTPTGDIMTRASSDVEQVRMMIGPGIMQGANTLLVMIVAIPLLIHLDGRLTLYAIAPLPLLVLLTNFIGGAAHRRTLAVQESFSRLTSFVQESLSGIRVIKSYAREENHDRRFEEQTVDYFGSNMHLIRMYGAFMPMMALVSGLAAVLVLYFGGAAVISGRIDLGTLVAFSVYLGMLIWPMVALGWVISLFQRGTVSARRLNEIFQTQPLVVDPPHAESKTLPKSGALEFRHLSFSYNGNGNGNDPVLRDISFVIEPGETVAIAGPTGSGKSTIAHLLSRRYPTTDATMFLGGIDANHVSLAQWRSQLIVASQEPFLFSDSLKANIDFGSRSLSEDELVAVSRQAAFDRDVRDFPLQYETIIGERGLTLSGGQKQRATLARALAVGGQVLVLDDVFSAVDAETEQEILDGLAELFGRRIVILITHRIATLRRADRVFFLQNGRCADSGPHDVMMATDGHYARWVNRQALREELERM